MAINLSDYQHAGIFIDEINNSVIDRPIPQENIVNFIPGFSKKGTVFNRPVLIKTKSDRTRYFGDIDKYLEKKGSFFHRTIEVALQSGPVWAMNILKTNSLDTLNYISVSLAAQYDNDVVLTKQYDDFFNKAGFWTRDTESFLFFANNSQRMIHLTNLGDGPVSIFMFKSPAPGFNLTADVWYGGIDKVPTWMNKNDIISDYMVRTVIVKGNWNNYLSLAADPYYAQYFTTSGIRKNKVDAFVRDRAVTLLGQYDCSLIPYFKDANGRNIFIESVINTDTDRTGVFCAFDIEKVETDFANGKIDIIGQTLVDLHKSKINFLSYQDTIEEIDTYSEKTLDTLSNTIGIGSIVGRTSVNKNQVTTGLVTSTSSLATNTPTLTLTSTSGTAIINNTILPIATTVTTFSAVTPPSAIAGNVGKSNYRFDAVYIDQNGVISIAQGTSVLAISGITINTTTEVLSTSIPGLTYPSTMPNNAIVIGYLFREAGLVAVTPTYIFANTYVAVSINNSGFISLTIGVGSTNDLDVQVTANNILDVVFTGTSIATKANYRAYRKIQFFNELVTKKLLNTTVIIDNVGAKVDLTNAIWTDNYVSGAGDKHITLTVGIASNIRTQAVAGKVIFYYIDNELGLSNPTFTAGNLIGLETRQTAIGTANYGSVAKLSSMYQDFYNGRINSGDFFYTKNLQASTSLKFVHYTNILNPTSVGDWIIMSAVDASTLGVATGSNSKNIIIESHPVNANNYQIQTGYDFDAVPTIGTPEYGLQNDGFLATGEIAFKVNNLVTTYTTVTATDVYDFDAKIYLKMYFIGSILKVEFMADNTLTTPGSIASTLLSINTTLNIYSGESGYTQTLEIEQHSSYTITDTKFLIDATRYPEVKVGDYVKAFIDSLALQPGEYPKKFSRILKKQPWSGNTTYGVNYQEISCDVKVDIASFGSGDLQTTRYTTIEDYVDTYKTIALSGFTTQATSWPDGTEARQSEILDIIGKETSLWWALVNKNKFNFRYLVDSFGLGLTEFSKQQLADITGKRKNCLGFINMPSTRAFKNSTNPSFSNTDGTLNTEYIKDGGNPASNPAFLYSFAQGSGKDDGRDTVGYFFPYLTINDGGRPLEFPPAAYIMNTYMRKNNSAISGVYNWTIAAGITDGRVLGIAGTEMDFTEQDLINMYQMGANPVNYAKNNGYYIESEWTASLSPLSALSYLHVREILIDLENDLYAMLLKYQWKFNTVAIRAKIKREADAICQSYVDRSALYAFKNVIDETNNTPELIDNQYGLLSTYCEPVKGLAIIVNQINVMNTGEIGNATGFTS